MPTTGILVLIERYSRYQIKPNYLKNRKFSAAAFFVSWNENQICSVLKKKIEPHRSSMSEVIDSERCA